MIRPLLEGFSQVVEQLIFRGQPWKSFLKKNCGGERHRASGRSGSVHKNDQTLGVAPALSHLNQLTRGVFRLGLIQSAGS